MRKPWFKVIFSIAIIIASIPTVITDIREGFIESLFWVIEMWITDVNKIIDNGLDRYDGFEEDVGKWLKNPDNEPGLYDWNEGKTYNKDAWDKEWKRTNKDK